MQSMLDFLLTKGSSIMDKVLLSSSEGMSDGHLEYINYAAFVESLREENHE